jgi:hypothetical protein
MHLSVLREQKVNRSYDGAGVTGQAPPGRRDGVNPNCTAGLHFNQKMFFSASINFNDSWVYDPFPNGKGLFFESWEGAFQLFSFGKIHLVL